MIAARIVGGGAGCRRKTEGTTMKILPTLSILLAVLAAPSLAVAQSRQPDDSVKRAQAVLAVLNQELAATYEQIKALQALLSSSGRAPLYVQGVPPALTTEQEVTEAKTKAASREQEIQSQIDEALKRVKDIDAQKQPILRRLREYLDAEPPPAPPAAPR
jgi:hypothetical protein